MDRTFYVYGLRCPIEGKIRYVGQSQNPRRRFMEHMKKGGNRQPVKDAWINTLRQANLAPELVILEMVEGSCALSKRVEKSWIGKLLMDEHPLTNERIPIGD